MTPVEFHPTPNPNAGKFVLPQPLESPAARSYFSAEDADDPVARALLAIDGVRSVFMVNDFVTISKDPAAGWDALEPRIRSVLEERV